MTIDRGVLAFAGFMTLASALLTWFYGPWWLLLTSFRDQHDAIQHHGFLPGRPHPQGAGCQAWRRVPVTGDGGPEMAAPAPGRAGKSDQWLDPVRP